MDKATVLEVFTEFEENRRELNDAQKHWIRDSFNTFLSFEYAEGESNYIFKINVAYLDRMRHYVGFEYVEEYIELYIQQADEVLIEYEHCDRVHDFVVGLQRLENA